MTTASANLVPVLMEANLPASEGATAVPEGTALTSFAVAMECATAEPAAPELLEDAGADAGEAPERSQRPGESLDALVAMVAPLVFMPPVVPVVKFSTVPERSVALDGCTDIEGAAKAEQCPAEDEGPAVRLVEECYSDSTSCSLPPVVVQAESVSTLSKKIMPLARSGDFEPEGESFTELNGVADEVAAASNALIDLMNQERLNVVPESTSGAETATLPTAAHDTVTTAKAPRVIEKAIEQDMEGVAGRTESAGSTERPFPCVNVHFAAPESENSADPAGTGGAEFVEEVNSSRKMELPADRRAVSAPVTLEDPAEEMPPAVTSKNLPNLPGSLPQKEAGADHLQFAIDDRGATASLIEHAHVDRAPAGAGLQAVERTVEAIATHAVQIRHQGSESLSMVVRPDEKTEVRIDLHLTDGQVEAQVFLNHGDRESFTSQWSDLQERLQQQGVRLAPLEDRAAGVGFGQSQHFSQHRESPPVREGILTPHTASSSRSPLIPTQTPARPILRGILECYA